MDIYNTLAGALVIGSMLLIGSGVVFLFSGVERAFATAARRAKIRRALKSTLGIVLFVAASIAVGRFSFERAYDSSRAYVPRNEVRWEPAGQVPTSSFDRFDSGSASNAELSHRS
jgi:hypothetical protein